MFYYAYVIFSPGSGRYYKGHSSDVDGRLNEHNSGKVRSTKAFRPWHVVYSERYPTRKEAIIREKYFKTAAGRRYLEKKIGYRGSPPA